MRLTPFGTWKARRPDVRWAEAQEQEIERIEQADAAQALQAVRQADEPADQTPAEPTGKCIECDTRIVRGLRCDRCRADLDALIDQIVEERHG